MLQVINFATYHIYFSSQQAVYLKQVICFKRSIFCPDQHPIGQKYSTAIKNYSYSEFKQGGQYFHCMSYSIFHTYEFLE